MSSFRKITKAGGLILAAITLFSPAKSVALSSTCSERGAAYRVLSQSDGVYQITVDGSDLISWYKISATGSVKIDIGSGFQSATAPGQFSTTDAMARFKIKAVGTNTQIAVSCAVGAAPDASGTAGHAGANSQTLATNTGVGANTMARFGQGSSVLTKDQMFLSTSNLGAGLGSGRFLPADWNAWASFETRRYVGGLDGVSFDAVGGVDRLVSPDLLLGVLGGVGRTFVTDTGTAEESTSPMLGAYFGGKFNSSLIMDGFLSFANPAYQISGANFRASRVSGGLTLTGNIVRPTFTIEPYLFARGYREKQPTYTIGGGTVIAASTARTVAASLGVRVRLTNAASPKKLVPYISAGADIKRTVSTLSGTDILAAPRLGIGLKGALGQGHLSIDVDLGKTRSDTFDQGVKLGYEISF